jgi:hypothetical protein
MSSKPIKSLLPVFHCGGDLRIVPPGPLLSEAARSSRGRSQNEFVDGIESLLSGGLFIVNGP